MAKKPFPVWASFFTLISAIILCSLGAWQLFRLEWKQDLLASIDKEYDKNAKDYPLGITDFTNLQKNEVKRGFVTGSLIRESKILVHFNQGYNLYVPMSLGNNKGTILVNLGWMKNNQDVNLPSKIEVTGRAILKKKSWRFGIKNMPDSGEWVYLDMDDVRAYTKLEDISNAVFYAEEINPDIDQLIVSNQRHQPNNNHLKYAIFWFAMCFVMFVIYYKRFFSKS